MAYTSYLTVHHQRRSGQEPDEAGADAEAIEMPLTGLLNLLSYRTQDYQPRDGTTHNGLGPPPSITN